jgi:hypothetical protein
MPLHEDHLDESPDGRRYKARFRAVALLALILVVAEGNGSLAIILVVAVAVASRDGHVDGLRKVDSAVFPTGEEWW